MKENNHNLFVIKNEKGEELEVERVMTIDDEDSGNHYLIYTDNKQDQSGNIRLFASIYDPSGKSLDLKPVTTAEEWDMIESVLASAQKENLKSEVQSEA